MNYISVESNCVNSDEKALIDELREHLRYDANTGELWWTKAKGRRRMDRPVGTPGTQGGRYLVVRFNKQLFYVHHIVWAISYGSFPVKGQILDHKDGDSRNNRISNLRLSDKSRNAANSGSRGGTSQYKGVRINKRSGKWVAAIMVKRVTYWLGTFEDEDDAARAVDIAAIKHFGEHARLNLPKRLVYGDIASSITLKIKPFMAKWAVLKGKSTKTYGALK